MRHEADRWASSSPNHCTCSAESLIRKRVLAERAVDRGAKDAEAGYEVGDRLTAIPQHAVLADPAPG